MKRESNIEENTININSNFEDNSSTENQRKRIGLSRE